MSERSTHHATFVIERSYGAAPARVFSAWADPAAKARWFVGPQEWVKAGHELDFRAGGRERLAGGPPGGQAHIFNALYYDIVQDQRIVYSYEMHLGETRISVSLATVEFKQEGTGTRMIFTEQGVFLDGYDDSDERERGTRALLDNLAAEVLRA
jgi:uncharacterized protein YndB with AHSA1/START domain